MPREQTYRTEPDAGGGFTTPGLGDLLLMLWRERGLIIVVFVSLFLTLAVAAVLFLGKTYTAYASLLARLDEAYAYNPVLSQTNSDISLGIEQIIQSEIRILQADILKRRTLEQLGLATVYPDLADEYATAAPGRDREYVMSKAVLAAERSLGVGAAPASPNIDASFEHEDPEVAAEFLNTLIAEYLDYRPDVLLGASAEGYEGRREEYEARLAVANDALEDFLAQNGIGEFESYAENLQVRMADVSAGLMTARADLQQAQAKLSALRSGMAQLPSEVEQYVDNESSGRLLELLLERADLLSRYTEESVPVQEIDQRIADMRAFLASGAADGGGARRTGPNPVLQQIEAAEIDLAADVTALSRRVSELTRQRGELQDEQLRIQALTPQYDRLSRDIVSLEDTVGRIAARMESNRAQRELAADTLDNVTLVQPAMIPLEGESLKKPALAGAFLFAGFVAVLAGLARGLMRGAYFGLGQKQGRGRTPAKPAASHAALKERARRATAPPPPPPPGWETPDQPAPAAAPPPQRRSLPVLAVVERHPDSGPAYG